MPARHWTDEVDKQSYVLFQTLSDAEIRRRQDLCSQQLVMAYDQRNEDALIDLQRMGAALTREMLRRYK